MADTLVKVEHVSKKFCRDLKTGLWYGVKDMVGEMLGRKNEKRELRPKEFWAVRDVSFELKRGECLGLIGHNGAGKSTLLKILNGLIKPDHGRVEMQGRVGALIELGAGFNPILTGRENIYINGAVLGFTRDEINAKLDAIMEFAEINDFIDTPVQYYSSGMKVRLGFAVASQLEPDVLIIDEVLAVGDASFRAKCFNRIQNLLRNTAVIFVSHNMPQITRISNLLILLEKGKVQHFGSNMGEIIAYYHAGLNLNSAVNVTGSGTISIEKVLIESTTPFDNDHTTIQYGSAFSVLIKFRINRDGLTNLKILIVLTDEEQNNVAQILEPIDSFKSGTILESRILFGEALFNAGRFYVSLAILEGEKGELTDVIYNATSFVVKSEAVGYAPIILKSQSNVTRII